MDHNNKMHSTPQNSKMYQVSSSDSLRSIAVAFDTIPSNLMKLNRLTSSTIFPGQMIYVPSDEAEENSVIKTAPTSLLDGANRFSSEFSFLSPLSPSSESSRPFEDLMVVSSKKPSAGDPGDGIAPLIKERKVTFEEDKRQRIRSGESTESEPFEEGFLKMRVQYVTAEQSKISGVMLVTPTAVMFDPNESDPIVQEEGCEKFGIMCKMTHIVSIAMYHDTLKMKTPSRSSSLEATTTHSHTEECVAKETKSLNDSIDVNLFQPQEGFEKLKEEFPFIHSLVKSVEEYLPTSEDNKETTSSSSFKKPMYLCIRADQPMQKTYHTAQECEHARTTSLEYWFEVSYNKSDQVYAFFLQWSPDNFDEDAERMGFVVTGNDSHSATCDEGRARSHTNSSLTFIEDFFADGSFEKEWEIISVEEAQRRNSHVNLLEMANDDSSLMPHLESTSHLLDDDQILFICHNLPPRCVGYTWAQVYSTFVHGTSLKTMYRNMINIDSAVVMVIKDTNESVFGAVCSCPLRVSDHFYGTGESFLFTLHPNEHVYKWTGKNSFFFKGDMDSLSIGGGKGSCGLWMDGDLYHGYTRSCETFDNTPLSSTEDFHIQHIEIWGFKET